MIGQALANRYQITRELGRGGMGIVYLAHDPVLERDVAIKLISSALLGAHGEERFRREARVVAKLDHPGIVGVYDVGQHEDSLFLVMPFLPGTNLREFLGQGVSVGEVLEIVIQVAEALDYSHARGVVHRDIKPENIMVAREENSALRARITDFGIATATFEKRVTETGKLVGTVAYLSPEQVTRGEIDSRSDLYSFGTLLYECFAGEIPFSGDSVSTLYRIANEIPLDLHVRNAEVDPELEECILRCLAKDPARRPQRASEVVDALKRCRAKLSDSGRVLMPLSVIQTARFEKPVQRLFVGREEEFAELQRRLNAAIAGECQFAVVAGEEGAGKSRLLEELEKLVRARRLLVLHGRMAGQEQAFPYQAFSDAVQEYLRWEVAARTTSPADFSDLAGDLVAIFPALTELLEARVRMAGGEPRKIDDRTYIYEVLARSLIRIGHGKPLIVFLEDLHAAEASLDALQYIIRRMGATPTLFVGTYRTTVLDRRHPLSKMLDSFRGDRRFVTIKLERFSPSEHRQFLEATIGSSRIDPRLIDTLYEATEGNPYFTAELVRSLVDTGRLSKSETGEWSFSTERRVALESLPATIQQAVEERIERLPEELREVLSVASILGRRFDLSDLESLVEQGKKLDEAVDGLITSGFITEERESRGDLFAFSSGVVRDVFYGRLSRRRRKGLHRQYADHLEKHHAGQLERVFSQLVMHYREGDVPEKVVEYGLKLARNSLEALSSDDAIRAARSVLDVLADAEVDRQGIEVETRLLLARAHRLGGNTAAALKEMEEVIASLQGRPDPSSLLDAIALTAEIAWDGRRIEETRLWVERGIVLARAQHEEEQLVRLLFLGATVANLRAEYDIAKSYLEEADSLQPHEETGVEEESSLEGGTLVVGFSTPILATHPVLVSLNEEAELFANAFETLTTADVKGNVIPLLCERWEELEGGKSFRFILREGIRAHDGRPLTAAAIKDAFEESIASSPENLPAAFASIAGVAGREETESDVAGIRVMSDRELVIELTEPIPIFPALLTDPRTSIALTAKRGPAALVGTGPFRLASLAPKRVILERSSDYWKGTPAHVESVELRAGISASEMLAGFRSGELDLVRDLLSEDLESVLRHKTLRASLVEAPRKGTYFVLFNGTGPLAQNPIVRQALCGVVRAHDLVRSALGRFAQPAEGLLPPGVLGHDPGRRRQPLSPEVASEMLRAIGPSLPLHLRASVHPILQGRYGSLARGLLRSWSEIGAEISIETPTMASFVTSLQKNTDLDLVVARWFADYDDPDTFVSGLFYSRNGIFRKYYSSLALDASIDQARGERSPALRETLYREIDDRLVISSFFLPLFHEIDYRVASPKIRRLMLGTTAPYVNYSQLVKLEHPAEVSEKKHPGGTIHVPIAGDVRTLDPSQTSALMQSEIIRNVFETLTHQTRRARIVPWLASRLEAEEGGRRYRLWLRGDVRFHDGRRLTARDVRYSFEHLLSGESRVRWLLSPVRGAATVLEKQKRELEGFRIVSDSEFTIDLEQPIAFFPALLAYGSMSIVPEGTERFDGSWEEGCVGTGPFRVTRFRPSHIELEPNPHYWRPGLPRCGALHFTMQVAPSEIVAGFRSGRFSLAWDLIPSDVEALRQDPKLAPKYRETPLLSTHFLVFNVHRGPLADEGLRRELLEAIDVEQVVRRNVGRLGVHAHGLIPPGLLGYAPAAQPKRISPESSRTARRGIQLKAMIHTLYSGAYTSLARDLLETARSIGFEVEVIAARPEYSSADELADVDVCISRWIADYPDPDTFMYSLLHSRGPRFGKMCWTAETDQLIERGRAVTDPNIRHKIYREIEETIARRALLVPLFHEQAYRFARPEVEGFEIRFAEPLIPYEELSVRLV